MIAYLVLFFLGIRWFYRTLSHHRTYSYSGYREASGLSYGQVKSTPDSYYRYVFFNQLRRLQDGQRVLINLHFPEPANPTGPLDYVLISRRGIFVFHWFNDPVRIEQYLDGSFWSNSLADGQRNTFTPVLKALHTQIEPLLRFLGEDYKDKIIPVLILGDNCQAEQSSYQAGSVRILRRFFFGKEMLMDRYPEILSDQAADQLYDELQNFSMPLSQYRYHPDYRPASTNTKRSQKPSSSGYVFPGYTGSGFQEARYYTKRSSEAEFKGSYGEFLIYRALQGVPNGHRILTNIYLPKANGTTTEIDLVQITPQGIFVFESKNVSGWIYGNEQNRYWTAVLAGGHSKQPFYNPIWQNQAHIDALDRYFEGAYRGKFRSYIVFSDRCELKNITVLSDSVFIIHRRNLLVDIHLHDFPTVLTEEDCDRIYHSLARFTNVSKEVKQRHNEAVSSWS